MTINIVDVTDSPERKEDIESALLWINKKIIKTTIEIEDGKPVLFHFLTIKRVLETYIKVLGNIK